ncbi:MAG TPA: hypothetical protein VFA02_13880 [Pseudacidobacterium sp.]|nr:hypothetical protein [Pseudacidobacterium sp.]
MLRKATYTGTNDGYRVEIYAEGSGSLKARFVDKKTGFTESWQIDTDKQNWERLEALAKQASQLPAKTDGTSVSDEWFFDFNDGKSVRIASTHPEQDPSYLSFREKAEQIFAAQYVVAKGFLDAGQRSASLQHWKVSAGQFKEGIAALGDSYVDTNALDDSGMRLVLAQSDEKKGEVMRASRVYETVLLTRLHLYANKENIKDHSSIK